MLITKPFTDHRNVCDMYTFNASEPLSQEELLALCR